MEMKLKVALLMLAIVAIYSCTFIFLNFELETLDSRENTKARFFKEEANNVNSYNMDESVALQWKTQKRGVPFSLCFTQQKERYVTNGEKPPGTVSRKHNIDTGHVIRSSLCVSWGTRGKGQPPSYFLTAVLLFRIHSEDLSQLSSRELLQWLVYLRYSGVEHVYVYDAHHNSSEIQREALKHFINEGYVTYIDWGKFANPYGIEKTQHSAYDHCRITWGNHTTWQAAIDIDEYPFSPNDTKPGFLTRAIKTYSKANPDLVEITMENFLFLGKPLNDTKHFWLADRILRRTPLPANKLVKPIYKPKFVTKCIVHHNAVTGRSSSAPTKLLRLNHYWGARLQNWGEDTPKVLNMTIPDTSMRIIVQEFLNCEKSLRLYRLREKRWN